LTAPISGNTIAFIYYLQIEEAIIMAERKGTMTNSERVEAVLQGKKPDRVPIWPFAGITYAAYAMISIADTYNKPKEALDAQRRTSEYFDWVFVPFLSYAAYGGWEFGGEIKWPSGEFAQAPTVTRFPVETEDDVWKLKTPDVATAGFVPLMTEFYEISSKEKLDNEPFNVMAMIGGPFTLAGNICGPEKLAKWTIKKPEAAHRLLRLATDHIIELAQYFMDKFNLKGGLAFTGEATAANQIISPKQFEQFVLPYVREEHEKVLDMGYKHIYCHICGEQNLNLPYWSQIPFGDPGIISIGHEVDIDTAAQHFPNDVILGNLEPAKLQVETPDEIYQATKELFERGMKIKGGYILSPGCGMPPMAPVENMMAMTEAVHDFGWY
jgi:uroporphyrinogen decarboxylase